jgi:RNA-splicing ligase RtcB
VDILNLSDLPEGVLRSWLPRELKPEKVVFFPDACPSDAPLPTGTATLLSVANWRKYAVSDVGCGMRFLRSRRKSAALTMDNWSRLAEKLKSNKGGLGDLGGGNHFLDALEPYSDDRLCFLIHTGSRSESGLVDDLVEFPARFDEEYERILSWARDNRAEIQAAIEEIFGETELVLDAPHNTFEKIQEGRVIIRKGAVRVERGELCIIPSHIGGDVVLARASENIGRALNSVSHGTGRIGPRGEIKAFGDIYDFGELRKKVLIPTRIQDSSLRTEGPFAYRDLDSCLDLLKDYVRIEERFSVIGYLGHL